MWTNGFIFILLLKDQPMWLKIWLCPQFFSKTHIRILFTLVPALFIPWPRLAYISGTLFTAPPTPALPPPRVTPRWTARDRARWTGLSCQRRTAPCGSGGTSPAAQRKGNPPLNPARRLWTKKVGVHFVLSVYSFSVCPLPDVKWCDIVIWWLDWLVLIIRLLFCQEILEDFRVVYF